MYTLFINMYIVICYHRTSHCFYVFVVSSFATHPSTCAALFIAPHPHIHNHNFNLHQMTHTHTWWAWTQRQYLDSDSSSDFRQHKSISNFKLICWHHHWLWFDRLSLDTVYLSSLTMRRRQHTLHYRNSIIGLMRHCTLLQHQGERLSKEVILMMMINQPPVAIFYSDDIEN